VTRALRIALTADPDRPVPPRYYGGIERLVATLAAGLVERGHDVHVFAHPRSTSPGHLHPLPGPTSRSRLDTARNSLSVASTCLRSRPDVVHSFGRLAYLAPLLPLRRPAMMSYQRAISPHSVIWGRRLSRGGLRFTACSWAITRPVDSLAAWTVIYNGVPRDAYRFLGVVPDGAPLVFLGRIEAIKGTHLAIAVARQAGRPLVIAGNVPDEPAARAYFEREVAPHLDGESVRHVGPVDDTEKEAILGSAAALLMPVQWDEPFGIVMAEALACGTPVIGLRRGAVPEVVDDGVTGFVCDTCDEMARAVEKLSLIDRAQCRQAMEKRFSDRAMVDAYEQLYRALLAQRG
jgi:glycosyltransferase involved in cell wall biosynthesis